MADADSDGYGVTGPIPASLQSGNGNFAFHFKDGGAQADFDFDTALFTREEKAKITEKMAKIVSDGLYNATPYDANDPGFHGGSSTKKLFKKNVKHLREGITHHPNEFADGSTNVGFKQGYYPVAFWTDHGTINQIGQFWFEDYANNLPAEEAFAPAAEQAELLWGSKNK